MAEQKLNTRIQLKHDTSTNWNAKTNFIPLAGEVIIYDDINKIKIGNGIDNLKILSFLKMDNIMTEKLIAFANNEYTVSQVRNSSLSADTKLLPKENGSIVWYYK